MMFASGSGCNAGNAAGLLELFDSMMTGSSGSIARMRLAASYCTLR